LLKAGLGCAAGAELGSACGFPPATSCARTGCADTTSSDPAQTATAMLGKILGISNGLKAEAEPADRLGRSAVTL
jgi:hypothetical protein